MFKWQTVELFKIIQRATISFHQDDEKIIPVYS